VGSTPEPEWTGTGPRLSRRPRTEAVAVLGLSIVVASASYFVVERPILRVKGRIGWWDRGPKATGVTPVVPTGETGVVGRAVSDADGGRPTG